MCKELEVKDLKDEIKQLKDEKAYLISAIKNAKIKDTKIEGLLEQYDMWRRKFE